MSLLFQEVFLPLVGRFFYFNLLLQIVSNIKRIKSIMTSHLMYSLLSFDTYPNLTVKGFNMSVIKTRILLFMQ